MDTARSGRSGTGSMRSGMTGRSSNPHTHTWAGSDVMKKKEDPPPRLGNGYDPPGALDCFADGTPPVDGRAGHL